MVNASQKILNVQDVSIKLRQKEVVADVSFELEQNQWLMLVGPNGAGKTTFIRALAGEVAYSGVFRFCGQNVTELSKSEFARHVGFLAQNNHLQFDFSVEQIVQMGRYCYGEGFLKTSDNEKDKAAVDFALAETGLEQLRHRSIFELSGGEQQRVFLAQVFAQDPQVLVLDEPANNLDITYQEQIFDLVQKWVRQPEKCVISVVHDLSLARAYGDAALLMSEGKVCAYGDVCEVLTQDNINAAYHADVAAFMKKLQQSWLDQHSD